MTDMTRHAALIRTAVETGPVTVLLDSHLAALRLLDALPPEVIATRYTFDRTPEIDFRLDLDCAA